MVSPVVNANSSEEVLGLPVKNTFIHFEDVRAAGEWRRTLRRNKSDSSDAFALRQMNLPEFREVPPTRAQSPIPAVKDTFRHLNSPTTTAENSERSSSDFADDSGRSTADSEDERDVSLLPTSSTTTSTSSTNWTFDGGRLASNDTRFLTALQLGIGASGRTAGFVLCITAGRISEGKSRSFKAAGGFGTLQVKSNELVDADVSVVVSLGTGRQQHRMTHNFAKDASMTFPDLDFTAALLPSIAGELVGNVNIELRPIGVVGEALSSERPTEGKPERSLSACSSLQDVGDGPFLYDITLRKMCGGCLGLELERSGDGGIMQSLIVLNVWKGGAVDAWNKQCDDDGPTKGKALRCGDRIVCVNGKRDAEDMLSECTGKLLLKISVARDLPDERLQSREEDIACGTCGTQEMKRSIKKVDDRARVVDGGDVKEGAKDAGALLLSLGSAGHPYSCGPACKYVKKARGCKDGAACTHCHLCAWSREPRGAGNEQSRK